MLQMPFVMVGMLMMIAQRAAASAQRVFEVLDAEPDMVDAPGAVDLLDCEGDVEFRDVEFAYGENAPLFRHLDLASASGGDRRPRRANRMREVVGRAPRAALLRRQPGERSSSTAPTSATSRSRASGRTSAPSPTSPSCSPNRSPPTSRSARPSASREEIESAAQRGRRPRLHHGALRRFRHRHR